MYCCAVVCLSKHIRIELTINMLVVSILNCFYFILCLKGKDFYLMILLIPPALQQLCKDIVCVMPQLELQIYSCLNGPVLVWSNISRFTSVLLTQCNVT